MKERPILFSGPMVRAILEGRKTQTRRIVKPKPEFANKNGIPFFPSRGGPVDYRICPFGTAGDRLWVREAFRVGFDENLGGCVIHYRAGGSKPEPQCRVRALDEEGCYRPSIHMPRWASRITLEITGVKIERLNDIGEEDAVRDGCNSDMRLSADSPFSPAEVEGRTAVADFAGLWESINGPGSWEENPWVWAVEFRRVES